MNNLNIFILFSTLIYFKVTENKSGNLKIAVGLVALYALYNLLKGSEGWTNSIYSTYPEAGRDNYLRSFGSGSECAEGGQFQAAASPPGFPFDHCVDGNGMICGKLYSSPTIMAMWGTAQGTESASVSYNSLPRDTNPRRNSRCETVTCSTHDHCQSNESRRYCQGGQCVECSDNRHCDVDSVCHMESSPPVCINRDQILRYSGDLRGEIGPYDDINDFGIKTCLNNDLFKTYLSSPSGVDDGDICSNPSPENVTDPYKPDGFSHTCCHSFWATNDSPHLLFRLMVWVGIPMAGLGFVGLVKFGKDNEIYRMGSAFSFVVGSLLLFLFLLAPILTSPVDNVDLDTAAEGAAAGGAAGGVLGPVGFLAVAADAANSDTTEDSDS